MVTLKAQMDLDGYIFSAGFQDRNEALAYINDGVRNGDFTEDEIEYRGLVSELATSSLAVRALYLNLFGSEEDVYIKDYRTNDTMILNTDLLTVPFGDRYSQTFISMMTFFDDPPSKYVVIYKTRLAFIGFISTWDTELSGASDSNQIELPLEEEGAYNFTVFYDGDIIKTITSYEDRVITFADGAGIKTIGIEGVSTGWRFNNSGDKLKITNISKWGDLNLGNSGNYFHGCSNLTITAGADLDMIGTTTLISGWNSCSSLTSFPLIDTSSVTIMSSAWENCSSLEEFPLLDTSIVSAIDRAFASCSSLTSFPNVDLRNMANGTNMFLNVNIGVDSWDALLIATAANNNRNTVTWSGGNAQHAFGSGVIDTLGAPPRYWTITDGGNSPTIFSSTWNTSKVGSTGTDQIELPLEAGGFYDFTVEYKGTTVATVTDFEDRVITFADGEGIKDIKIVGFIFEWKFINAKDKLKLINISNWGTLQLGNNGSYFHGCSNLTITAKADLNMSQTTALNRAFMDCTSLTSFPLIDTSGVTNMTQAWQNCSSLIYFPLLDTSGISSFTSTWYGCSGLVNFPLINTSNATSLSFTWFNCSSLFGSFPLIDTSNVVFLQSVWRNCSSLTSFPLINTINVIDFSSAWRDCSSVTSFPLINTAKGANMSVAWYGCVSLVAFPTIDLRAMTNGTQMLFGSDIGTTSWDALITKTELNNQNPNVSWHGGDAKYTGGFFSGTRKARQRLIDDHNWTIFDGGEA